MADESKSVDLLGIKPVGDSIKKVTSGTVDGAAAFLSRICLPAAEEFGLLLRDRVHAWRTSNLAAIAKRAEEALEKAGAPGPVRAHPRAVFSILEEGSWVDDPVVQDLWGGLLSSSCTESGDDDSNMLFINLLGEVTKLQARLVKYLCENAVKSAMRNGLIYAERMILDLATLKGVTGEDDIYRLDRELDYLDEIGLVRGGFEFGPSTDARVEPSPFALQMYVRCQGSRKSPIEYFELEIPAEGSEAVIEATAAEPGAAPDSD